MQIRLREIFKESWKQVKANYTFLIPLFLLVIVVSLALNLEGDDVFSVSGILSLLLSPVLYYVVTHASLQISRNQKIGFKDIFKGFDQKIYLSFLAVSVFLNLVVIGMIALGAFVAVMNPFIGIVFSLAFFGFVFVYFIGVIFFPQYRLIDVRSNFWLAIQDSFRLGVGNRVVLLKFVVIAFLLNVVGALLLGLGLLVTLPLTSLVVAHLYDKLKINN